jgi:BirA family transcriptional regulator, biotin operon repressor / biotin---[acetyl-CoA-carboxylase] ligase
VDLPAADGPALTTPRELIVRALADGDGRSMGSLIARLGLTEATLHTALEDLKQWGLGCEPCGVDGVRLTHSLDLIDATLLEAALSDAARARVERIEIFGEIGSTNTHLLEGTDLPPGRLRVCLAEFQSAGRGRRGRTWLAPFGSGLCLSVAWLFPALPPVLGALSLAAGVAVVRALERFGVTGLALKWPNDVLKEGAKLGGLLSELRVEAAGPAYIIVGVGLNVVLPAAIRCDIVARGGVPPADLASGPSGPPSRTRLAAALVEELLAALVAFEARGFDAFIDEWSRHDALDQRPVRVETLTESFEGIARGVCRDGTLKVDCDDQMRYLNAGDVTLRPA